MSHISVGEEKSSLFSMYNYSQIVDFLGNNQENNRAGRVLEK
jgi:hypothetical protein